MPANSQFYNKMVAHENEHLGQWQSGMLSDLLTGNGLMSVLYPLTDSTKNGLRNKMATASDNWFNNQEAIYNGRISASEAGAYQVSDPINPPLPLSKLRPVLAEEFVNSLIDKGRRDGL